METIKHKTIPELMINKTILSYETKIVKIKSIKTEIIIIKFTDNTTLKLGAKESITSLLIN